VSVEVVASVGAPSPDPGCVLVRQAGFKSRKLSLRVFIARSSSASEPIAVPRKVVPIEGVHCQVLCAVPLSPSKGTIGEASLTERLCDVPLPRKPCSELCHGEIVTSQREMPKYRHGVADGAPFGDTPVPLPKAILVGHAPILPRTDDVRNGVVCRPSVAEIAWRAQQ
jgi:hypothetical protein